MTRARQNRRRQARIEDEIIVDAYNSDERALSWYYYLEGKMQFPFSARCISARTISPLQPGEEVQVLSLAREHDCQRAMFAIVPFAGRRIGVPLEQLKPVGADPDMVQAVEDWVYWVGMRYEF